MSGQDSVTPSNSELQNVTTVKVELQPTDDSSMTCVLCNKIGHIGKDCVELVCILCCSKGHLMDQCTDFNLKVSRDMDVGSEADRNNVLTSKDKPSLRLKNLSALVDTESKDKNVTGKSKRTTSDAYEKKSEEFDDEESYKTRMMNKFYRLAPPDVIELFKQRYCGLCCIKFSCKNFAWKHYNGRGHYSLLERQTYRNRPLFWQMIFHALISAEPRGATEKEIFRYIRDTFSAHLPSDDKAVQTELVFTIKDMVERFNNVVVNEGVYKLRDRKPGEAPKFSYGSFSNRQRYDVKYDYYNPRNYDRKYEYNRRYRDKSVDRYRDLKYEVKHHRESRDKENCARGERYRYRSRSRSRSRSGGRSGDQRSRNRRSHDPRTSVKENQESRSKRNIRDDESRSASMSTETISPCQQIKSEPSSTPPIANTEITSAFSQNLAIIPNVATQGVMPNSILQATNIQDIFQAVGGPPTLMAVTPSMLSTMFSSFLAASQRQQALTPPATPEEF